MFVKKKIYIYIHTLSGKVAVQGASAAAVHPPGKHWRRWTWWLG